MVGRSAIARTLTECRSRDEWLAAAKATTRLTGLKVAAVLQNDCFRAPFMVIDVPSCTVTDSIGGVNLGPCPKTFPKPPRSKLSAGIAGGGAALVPFVASTVEACLYYPPPTGVSASALRRTRLIASTVLPSDDVGLLEQETNRLVSRPRPPCKDSFPPMLAAFGSSQS